MVGLQPKGCPNKSRQGSAWQGKFGSVTVRLGVLWYANTNGSVHHGGFDSRPLVWRSDALVGKAWLGEMGLGDAGSGGVAPGWV